MALRFRGEVVATPWATFMQWFFLGAYLNIFGIYSACSTRYNSSTFTKMKWFGVLSGFGANTLMIFLVYIIHGVLYLTPWGGIILVAYYIVLIIFNVIYKVKTEKENGDTYQEHGYWSFK